MKRRTAALIALGVTVTGVAVTSSAHAAEDDGFVSGRVIGHDGEPAAGATVAVFAETPDVVALETGESGQMPLIGTATTDADGSYTLDVPATFDASAYADTAGVLTFSAVVQDGAYVQTDAFQRQVDTSGGRARFVAVGDADQAFSAKAAQQASARALVEASPASLSFDLASPQTQKVKRADSVKAAAGDVHTASTSVSVKDDYGSRWAYVGQWASTTSGVTAKFHYNRSASSSLGVAVSTSGKAGTFKADGTRSRSSDATVGFAKTTGKGSFKFRTQFHYQKRLYTTCTAGWTCSSKYKIEPVSWRGGASTLNRTIPSATKCVPHDKGTDHSQKATKAYTFKAGVSNAGMTTVELSAQSGFSSTVRQDVHFTKAGRLCGRTGYPGSAPQVLTARPS